ncbi:MAG: hypothetical protein ACE5G0_15695, partial [Rhodothermales bacterium]
EITLNPEDYTRLEAYGIVEDLNAMHDDLRWTTSEKMKTGDWVVQTPDAAVRRLKEELVSQLRSRLGLLAVMKNRG